MILLTNRYMLLLKVHIIFINIVPVCCNISTIYMAFLYHHLAISCIHCPSQEEAAKFKVQPVISRLTRCSVYDTARCHNDAQMDWSLSLSRQGWVNIWIYQRWGPGNESYLFFTGRSWFRWENNVHIIMLAHMFLWMKDEWWAYFINEYIA